MQLFQQGSGHPVLFIHGIPTNKGLWGGVIERMRGEFSCCAVDLPGMGTTSKEPYGADYLDKTARRIEALREQHRIDRWHVVGHDAGAAIAVHYANAYQEKVGRLVLLSPAIFPDLKPYLLLELLRKPVIGEILAPALHSIFWNVAMARAVRNQEGTTGPSHNEFQSSFRGFDGSWQFMRVLRWGEPNKVLAKLPSYLPLLKMPTLVVNGLRDTAIPPAFAQRACGLIPNSQFVEVDSGHFIPLNRPAFLAGTLGNFFAPRLKF